MRSKLTSAAMAGTFPVFILRTGLAAILALLLSQVKLDFVEYYLYDLRTLLAPASDTSEQIVIINYDQKTVLDLRSDIRPEFLRQTVEKVASANPKLIILNFRPEEFSGTLADKKTLADSLAANPKVVFTTDNLPLKGDEAGLKLEAPYDKIKVVSAPMTVDLKVFAKDAVTRRLLTSYQDIPLGHLEIANMVRQQPLSFSQVRGSFNFADSTQTYIHYRNERSFRQISLSEVYNGLIDSQALRDKLVIIGMDTKKNGLDYIRTPYNRDLPEMSKNLMHANMLETLINDDAPQRVSPWLNSGLVLLVCILTVHIALGMRPTQGLMVLGATILSVVLINSLFFIYLNVWLNLAAPLISLFLCYYLFIPYRLIVENRRSWEYYQKNKLLSQVEELKTNFISMMSHDLKTPIARIQGMSEMIVSDQNTLSSIQREAVDTIKHSADDLLKFITAILNYGKIESEGVQLHLQSKDLNNLLQEVIRKHEFLAKVKRIEIVSELEPIFPIPVDAELMKQVFSNLVENAIKYSPEDTKILITSEETDSKIIVQVADQGPGIPPDEIANVFMKFFRSKNAKSSPIKGSGLGLYLAKYFTELHHGRIFVESSHGQGATFTVELPMEQGGNHA